MKRIMMTGLGVFQILRERLQDISEQPLYYRGAQTLTFGTLSGVLLIRLQWIFGIILRMFKDSCKRRIGILQDITKQPPGLETWFIPPNLKPVMPPPRWKMAIVVFVAAYTTSMVSRSLLGFLLSDWPLIASTLLYSKFWSSR